MLSVIECSMRWAPLGITVQFGLSNASDWFAVHGSPAPALLSITLSLCLKYCQRTCCSSRLSPVVVKLIFASTVNVPAC